MSVLWLYIEMGTFLSFYFVCCFSCVFELLNSSCTASLAIPRLSLVSENKYSQHFRCMVTVGDIDDEEDEEEMSFIHGNEEGVVGDRGR